MFQFLFEDIFIKLLEKGIKLAHLLKSEIFYYEYNGETWPRISTITTSVRAPYNGSLFHLRDEYDKIFSMIGTDTIL